MVTRHVFQLANVARSVRHRTAPKLHRHVCGLESVPTIWIQSFRQANAVQNARYAFQTYVHQHHANTQSFAMVIAVPHATSTTARSSRAQWVLYL